MQPAAASLHTAGRLPMIDNPASSATTKEKVEFQPITPVSLREMVLTRLREAILRGNLLPGQRLTETLLSRQMQVAQNVVREALQELEFQGFVVRVPNKGTFITDYSLEDINQIYRFRMELEGLAVQLAREAGRPNGEDLESLEQAWDGMKAGAEAGDFWAFSRSDLEFHETLWRMSGNRCVEKALRAVATPQFAYVLIRSFRHTRLNLPAIAHQHREIINKVKTAEPSACREFLEEMTRDFWRQIRENVAAPE